MDILKDYIDANPEEFHQFSDDDMKKMHQILLGMIDDVFEFCDKKGLALYASGGTALGTLRHKGFIPWDEDVDFSMLRKDCDVLLSDFVDYFQGKYFIEAPNSALVGNHVFIKIKKANTVMTDLLTKKGCSGFCIDIFPIDYASNNRIIRTVQGLRYMLMRDILYVISFSRQYYLCMKDGFRKCSFGTRFIARGGVVIGRLFGIVPLEKWINHYDRIVQRKTPTDYWVIASGIHSYAVETFHSSVYLPDKFGEFEGRRMRLPGKVEVILERFYGDYMTPPPPEKRAKHYFLDISFEEEGKEDGQN